VLIDSERSASSRAHRSKASKKRPNINLLRPAGRATAFLVSGNDSRNKKQRYERGSMPSVGSLTSSMDRSISTHNLRPHADFDCRYQSGGSGPNGGPVLMPAGNTDPPRAGRGWASSPVMGQSRPVGICFTQTCTGTQPHTPPSHFPSFLQGRLGWPEGSGRRNARE
jgi:hypothetical protein